MSETWEQTKLRLKQTLGVSITPEPIEAVVKPRYDEAIPEVKVALYEIRKITLPIDPEFPQGKVVVTSVDRQEAEWWLESKLKVKSFTDDTTDMKTLVFYEKFLIGASPKERNIYSNPERFCVEDFPDFKTPKRIN